MCFFAVLEAQSDQKSAVITVTGDAFIYNASEMYIAFAQVESESKKKPIKRHKNKQQKFLAKRTKKVEIKQENKIKCPLEKFDKIAVDSSKQVLVGQEVSGVLAIISEHGFNVSDLAEKYFYTRSVYPHYSDVVTGEKCINYRNSYNFIYSVRPPPCSSLFSSYT